MGWVYLDDRFPEHPKILAVGGDGAWLAVCALAYTNRGAGDGIIPKAVVPRLSDRKQPATLAKALCDAGLWHDKGTHYEINDYDEWNAKAMRRRAAARKAAKARWAPANAPPPHTDQDANAYPIALPSDTETHDNGNARAMQYPKPQAPIDPIGVTELKLVAAQPEKRDRMREPDKPSDPLVERWVAIVDPRSKNRAQAQAPAMVNHLRKHLDDKVIDECIGRCETESTSPPRDIKYLLLTCRNWANQHTPGTSIPEPPDERDREVRT